MAEDITTISKPEEGGTDPIAMFRNILGTAMPPMLDGEPTGVKNNLNIEGDYKRGPAPVKNETPNGTLDLVNAVNDYMGQADSWAQDPYKYGKSFDYGAGIKGANFERYYSHPQFQKLGFSPWIDNEAKYNKNSSWFNDFTRMSSQWGSLFATGWKSFYQSGEKSAEEYEKAMAIGSSTKGGMGGFFNNLFLNSAFSIGIASEIVAEEAALIGLTVLTGTAAAPLLIAETAKNMGVIKRAWDVAHGLKSTAKWVKDLKDINKARDFWNATKGARGFLNPLTRTTDFAADVIKGANSADKIKDFANIKKGMGAFYRDLREINAAYSEARLEGATAQNQFNDKLINEYYTQNGRMPTGKEAEQIFKNSQGVGLATTIANIPTIFYSNKIVFDKLFKGIRPISVLDKELVENSGRFLNKSKEWKQGANVYSALQQSSTSKVRKALFNSGYVPWSRKYIIGNLAESLQEIFQEIISAATAKYYGDVYKDPTAAGMYNVLAATGYGASEQFTGKGFETFMSGLLMGSIAQAPQAAIFDWAVPSYQKKMNPEKYKTLQAQREKRENAILNAANTILKNPLGYFDKNVEHAVRVKKIGEAINQAQLDDNQKAIHDLKDELSFEHLWHLASTGKTDLITDHFNDLSKMNDAEIQEAFGIPESEVESVRRRLDEAKAETNKFKSRYDAYSDKFPNPFDPYKIDAGKNPEGFKKEWVNYNAWEELKKDALLSHAFFEKNLSRRSALFNDLMADPFINNASANDINIILDSGLRKEEIKLLQEEVKLLPPAEAAKKQKKLEKLLAYDFLSQAYTMQMTDNQRSEYDKATETEQKLLADIRKGAVAKHNKTNELYEVLSINGDYARVREQSTGKEKTVKRKSLSLVTPSNEPSDFRTVSEQVTEELYNSYKDYLRTIADITDSKYVFDEKINESFVKVKNHLELGQEAEQLSIAINLLHDPTFLEKHLERRAKLIEDKENKRIEYLKEGIQKLNQTESDNFLLNALQQIAVTIDPADADKLFRQKNASVDFYDAISFELIKESNPKYQQIQDAIKDWQIQSGVAEVESTPSPAEVVQQSPIATSDLTTTTITPELRKLLDAYRAEDKEREANGEPRMPNIEMSDYELVETDSFKDFSMSSGKAAKIKNESPPPAPKQEFKGAEIVSTDETVYVKTKEIIEFLENNGYNTEEIFTMSPKEAVTAAKMVRDMPENVEENDYMYDDHAPKKIVPGMEKAYEKSFSLMPDETAYVDERGELYIRVSTLKNSTFDNTDIKTKRAAQRGDVIDNIVRLFFEDKIEKTAGGIKSAAESFILNEELDIQFTDNVYLNLYGILAGIDKELTDKGFEIYSSFPTIGGNIGTARYAGTIDLMLKKDDKYYIVDLKTSSKNRREIYDQTKPSINYKESDRIQLNAYKELIKQTTGIEVSGLYILPIQVTTKKNSQNRIVTNLVSNTGIEERLISVDSTEAQKADIEKRRPTSYIKDSKDKKSSLETFRNEAKRDWDGVSVITGDRMKNLYVGIQLFVEAYPEHKELLDKFIKKENGTIGITNNNLSFVLNTLKKQGITTESELGGKINAKYDAELAALNQSVQKIKVDSFLIKVDSRKNIYELTDIEYVAPVDPLEDSNDYPEVVEEDQSPDFDIPDNLVHEEINDMLTHVYTLDDLKELEDELIVKLSSQKERERLDINAEIVDRIIADMRKQIISKFDFSTLKVGDVLLMANNKKMWISEKLPNDLKLKDVGKDDEAYLLVSSNDIYNKIKLVYKDDMTDSDVNSIIKAPVSETDKELSNETMNTANSTEINSPDAIKDDYTKADNISPEQAKNDLFNNLNDCD